MGMDLTVSEFIAKVENGEFDEMKIHGFAGMYGGACAVKPEKVCKEALIAALRQSLAEAEQEMRKSKVSLVVPMKVCDEMVTAIASEQINSGDAYDEALWDTGFEMDEDAVEMVCYRLYLIEKAEGSRLRIALDEYRAALKEALQESVKGCWVESGITIQED